MVDMGSFLFWVTVIHFILIAVLSINQENLQGNKYIVIIMVVLILKFCRQPKEPNTISESQKR